MPKMAMNISIVYEKEIEDFMKLKGKPPSTNWQLFIRQTEKMLEKKRAKRKKQSIKVKEKQSAIHSKIHWLESELGEVY